MKAKETDADLIGISAPMTTNPAEAGGCLEILKEEGMRSRVKVMVGSTPATQTWADKIGADCYAENASEAVEKAKNCCYEPHFQSGYSGLSLTV